MNKLSTTLFLFLLITSLLPGCQRNGGSNQSAEGAEVYKNLAANRVNLPNGWSLTPPGSSLDLDDLPLTMVVSPSKKLMAITNNGQSTQSITLIDAGSQQILDTAKVGKAYVGLAFSDDEKMLYASGGNDNRILTYRIENQQLVPDQPIVLGKPWPTKISPAGLCVDNAKDRLYVVTKEDSSLYVTDTKTRQVVRKLNIGSAGYTCLLSANKQELYVSLWGGSGVAVIDVNTVQIVAKITDQQKPQ